MGYYVIPSVQNKFECLSVRHHLVSALYFLHFFTDCLQALHIIIVDIGEEWFGIVDG